MDTVTREETKAIQKVIIFLIVPLIVFGFLKVRYTNKREYIVEKMETLSQKISRYIEKQGTLPTQISVNAARDAHKAMGERFQMVASFSEVPVIKPPDDIVEKGVYFKKQVYLAEKELRKLAERNDTTIVNTLGFGDALPLDREVPLLLRKLETEVHILKSVLENNITAVTQIKWLDDMQYSEDKEHPLPFTEISLRIDMQSRKENLIQVLHKVGMIKPIIAIKDIDVQLIKEGTLETSIVFSRLVREE